MINIANQFDTTYGLLKVRAAGLLSKVGDAEAHSNNCISAFYTDITDIGSRKWNYRFFNDKIFFEEEFNVENVELFNLAGQYFKLDLSNLFRHENFIDVQHLNPGFWLFRTVSKSGIITGTFFKVK